MDRNTVDVELLRPLVTGWLGKLNKAREAKKAFDTVSEQCTAFFSGAVGFMWDDEYKHKHMGGGRISPKFKITLAKAFEMVALFGPVLYWQNPQREVRSRPRFEISPELFGDPNDPHVQEIFAQAEAEQNFEVARNDTRNRLMELVLNYTPHEQPEGGLATASDLAITEALVKGRGCLWPEPFQFPGSQRTLTGCFWDSVDDLFIDPDCKDATLSDAKWIARRHVNPHWEVERRFGLPKDSLKGKGSIESGESQGARQSDEDRMLRASGETYDSVVWFEIWSKGGVGTRMTGVDSALAEGFDDVVGDFAYLVVAHDVPFPLNAPPKRFNRASDSEVVEMFEWPVPYWTDDRWPVALLDFYRKPGSAWPIAPMAPGLGELTFLNIMVSHMANRIWSSSRDFIAVLKSASQEVTKVLKRGEDLAVFELDDVHQEIGKVISFMQQPETRYDVWRIIDRVAELFDKRVGLTELAYGLNPGGVQSRTAEDIKTKQENLRVRPDRMANQVEAWQSEVANLEKFAIRWEVEAEDIAPLLGPVGSRLWTSLVTDADPELFAREMKAMVTAGSVRKPNKQRDTQNLNQVMPYMLSELSTHADVTGDTSGLNHLYEKFGRAIEMDMSGLQMGPRVPQPPPPEVQEMEQQRMQSEAEQQQLETEIKQIELQIKQIELQKALAEAQQGGMETEQKQIELEFDQAQHEQEIEQSDADALQRMLQQRAEGVLKLQQLKEEGTLKLSQARDQAAEKLKLIRAQSKAKAQAKPATNGSKT